MVNILPTNGNGSGDQHPQPPLPVEVEEPLHGKLACVGPRHGGGLPCGQDADGPDVEGGRAELAAEEEAALVDVRAHRLVVGGELVGVDAALRDARVVDVVVGLAVQALGEDAYLWWGSDHYTG